MFALEHYLGGDKAFQFQMERMADPWHLEG